MLAMLRIIKHNGLMISGLISTVAPYFFPVKYWDSFVFSLRVFVFPLIMCLGTRFDMEMAWFLYSQSDNICI